MFTKICKLSTTLTVRLRGEVNAELNTYPVFKRLREQLTVHSAISAKGKIRHTNLKFCEGTICLTNTHETHIFIDERTFVLLSERLRLAAERSG